MSEPIEMKKKYNKNYCDAAIYAPLPPQPPGGIGSIVGILFKSWGSGEFGIEFSSPCPKSGQGLVGLMRPIINAFKLLALSLKIKRSGRILIFSSAYTSFYEKLFWSFLIACIGRKPLVMMVDGNFPKFWDSLNTIIKFFLKAYVQTSRLAIACQSEGWKDYYQGIFGTGNIAVVGATCSEEFFNEPINNHNKANNFFQLLYIGWVITEKGIIDLLDAVSILSKKIHNFRLVIVGPLFDKGQYWEEEVAARGLHGMVEFTGSVANKSELIQILDDSSIFILPSHFEGLPVVMIEAMARGKPCVGTNVGAIPDLLNHGHAGIVVLPHEPSMLADELSKLISHPELLAGLSKNAYSRARELYSYKNCLDSFQKILNVNQVIGNSN